MNKKRNTKNLYLLCGPSGAGKNTLQYNLIANGLVPVQPYTTRQQKFNEESTYRFISEEEFLSKSSQMIGLTKYQDAYYGTTPDAMDEGDICIVESQKALQDIVGRYRIRPVVVIGITCSRKELEARMTARGDNADSIKTRLEESYAMFSTMTEFCDVIFRNEGTFEELTESALNYIELRETQAGQKETTSAPESYLKPTGRKPLCLLPEMTMNHLIHDKATLFPQLLTPPTAYAVGFQST